MNIEQYLEELIKREGGYVNNPQIGAVQPNTVLLKQLLEQTDLKET